MPQSITVSTTVPAIAVASLLSPRPKIPRISSLTLVPNWPCSMPIAMSAIRPKGSIFPLVARLFTMPLNTLPPIWMAVLRFLSFWLSQGKAMGSYIFPNMLNSFPMVQEDTTPKAICDA